MKILKPLTFLGFLFLVNHSHAHEDLQVVIDGPANCREKPKGKILHKLPDQLSTQASKVEGEWLLVNFEGKACWTHKKNIKAPLDKKPLPELKLSRPTDYIEIKEDADFDYGYFESFSGSDLKIQELLNLKCFYIFDYAGKEKLTQKEFDEAHSNKLPWCSDPSGGAFLKPTGKIRTYEADGKSKFSLWHLKSEKQEASTTRDVFLKHLKEVKELIKLKVRPNTKNVIDTIETVYTD